MSDRSSFLSVLLGGFALVVFMVFMTMITAGFFIYIIVACAAVVGLGTFHWLWWGAALSAHLEKERDEERLLERAREQQHADEGRITNRPAR
jgi:hypothetical protein